MNYTDIPGKNNTLDELSDAKSSDLAQVIDDLENDEEINKPSLEAFYRAHCLDEMQAGLEAIAMVMADHKPERTINELDHVMKIAAVLHAGDVVSKDEILYDYRSSIYRHALGVGNESLSSVANAVGKAIVESARWAIKNLTGFIESVGGRIGRMQLRHKMLTNKVATKSSIFNSKELFKAPATIRNLAFNGVLPTNASQVVNVLSRIKGYYSVVHGTYPAYLTSFKEAVGTDRESSIEITNNFMETLATALNAKNDTGFGATYVATQIPGNVVGLIMEGGSYSDIGYRLQPLPVKQEWSKVELATSDALGLKSVMNEVGGLIRIINELYGSKSSRLITDFKKAADAAKNALTDENGVTQRSASSAINWYIDNQNRIYGSTLVHTARVINAAMDYVESSLNASGKGSK